MLAPRPRSWRWETKQPSEALHRPQAITDARPLCVSQGSSITLVPKRKAQSARALEADPACPQTGDSHKSQLSAVERRRDKRHRLSGPRTFCALLQKPESKPSKFSRLAASGERPMAGATHLPSLALWMKITYNTATKQRWFAHLQELRSDSHCITHRFCIDRRSDSLPSRLRGTFVSFQGRGRMMFGRTVLGRSRRGRRSVCTRIVPTG
jgi:hypothetical protein